MDTDEGVSKILVVEDDGELREALVEILNENGTDAIGVADGLAAYRYLRSGNVFHAVLSDLRLPKMCGLTLLEKLNGLEQFIPPTVILSGSHERFCIERALRLGAFDFILKPCEFPSLLETVFCALEVGRIKLQIHQGRDSVKKRQLIERLRIMNAKRHLIPKLQTEG